MRIVHVCLSCFFIDGFAYQENELVRQHVISGHEVLVIASTETYGSNNKLIYVNPSVYIGDEGAKVIRLPYSTKLPHIIKKKLRIHYGVYEMLCEFRPDVIAFHGLCGWELMTVAKYKKNFLNVKLFVDSHEDYNNSARFWLSKIILHKIYYSWVISKSISIIDKIHCVSLDTIEFVIKTYGLPRYKTDFYPLGGWVFGDDEYMIRRKRVREELFIDMDKVLFIQTGKMGYKKRIIESLRSFANTPGDNMRFVIVGSFDEDVKDDALRIIESDDRICYVGWSCTEKLKDYLCGSDIYIQPGSQSATMQMSLCLRCAVVLDKVLSHRPYVKGNGWLISTENELCDIYSSVRDNPWIIKNMQEKSLLIAKEMLDYERLALKVIQ